MIGCGGGGGGGGGALDGTIYFAMPSFYIGLEKHGEELKPIEPIRLYRLPQGNSVKFYTATVTGAETFSADHVFSGTTGPGNIQATLPRSLMNQKRYIYAIVNRNGSFDPRGRSQTEIINAVKEKIIIAGQVMEYNENEGNYENALVDLINSGKISGFQLSGIPLEGETTASFIQFNIPRQYDRKDGENTVPTDIPLGKAIKFYMLEKELEITDTSPISPVYCFEGKKTGDALDFELPSSLINKSCYIIGIININGNFELKESTVSQLMTAMENGDVLYGKATDGKGNFNSQKHDLKDGFNNIENFEFNGK